MPFSGQSIIVILIVGLIAGWIAAKIVIGGGLGLIGDIVVGILGAFIAAWLLPKLGFRFNATTIVREIIYATIGAVVLLLLIRLVRRL